MCGTHWFRPLNVIFALTNVPPPSFTNTHRPARKPHNTNSKTVKIADRLDERYVYMKGILRTDLNGRIFSLVTATSSAGIRHLWTLQKPTSLSNE